jgi:hypothetical protein
MWQQLPTSQQRSIASVLALMIARQLTAMQVPPVMREEHHE